MHCNSFLQFHYESNLGESFDSEYLKNEGWPVAITAGHNIFMKY